MFNRLSGRLGAIFDGLRKRGALSAADVDAALRDVRVALLDADAALPVTKDFIAAVREKATGAKVLQSIAPGQMVIKIVHDHLVEMLGGGGAGVNLAGPPPAAILMLGLQGSGKTTTCAKLGLRLQNRDKKKVLMASLDVYRPAAQRQLAVLGEQAKVSVLQAIFGEQPLAIARRTMNQARLEGFDAVILDTAGRLHIDDEMMAEALAVKQAVNPVETLLAADAMTGQDAVNIAREFNEKVGITGIALTRIDGDSRGGAALSMRAVTGRPIKIMGVGEKLDQMEDFDGQRIASRILGMGDVAGLVEKASLAIEKENAEKMAAKMLKGSFTLDDMAEQLSQLRKMGDLSSLLGMIPGLGKLTNQIASANIGDKTIIRQQAIIQSMTAAERRNAKSINGSRRRRIASGSGVPVQEVNRLLKQYLQMADMMKKMGKIGPRGMERGLMPGLFPSKFPR